jgi:hypothetical protein
MKKITVLCSLLLAQLAGHAQLVIDLSTAKNNSNSTIMAGGAYDDTWTLIQKPSGAGTWIPRVAETHFWPHAGYTCAKWITTDIIPGTFYYATNEAESATEYIYQATFSNMMGTASAATFNISAIAADQALTMEINGFPYTPNATLANISHAPSTIFTNITMTVNPAHIVCGTNVVKMKVKNGAMPSNFSTSQTGFFLCGTLNITTAGQPTLGITGNTNFCMGDPLTFTGSASYALPATFWEIAECTSAGVPNNSSAVWNTWIGGTAGTYTFPSLSFIGCDKYYKIKMAGGNTCGGWVETNKIIYINCLPTIEIPGNTTICKGQCVNLSVMSMEANTSYVWTPARSNWTGSINACPQVTTTYTLTATNTVTGCVNTGTVTVTVYDNDPSFSPSANTSPATYYTVSAMPNILNANTIPGYNYAWFLEELNSSNVVLWDINNPSCWWNYPSATVFRGFDDLNVTYTGTTYTLPSCSSPSNGMFLYNHIYRITRGSYSSYCGWQQSSWISNYIKAPDGTVSVIFEEDFSAPDMSQRYFASLNNQAATSDDFNVFPNPGKDEFTIELAQKQTGVIEVYDMLGSKVQSIQLDGSEMTYRLNLREYAKGIYVLKMISGNNMKAKKLIVE